MKYNYYISFSNIYFNLLFSLGQSLSHVHVFLASVLFLLGSSTLEKLELLLVMSLLMALTIQVNMACLQIHNS